VVEASERMRGMLDDYVDYLKVGKRKGADEKADLEVALDGALANLRPAIEDSGAEIIRQRLPVVAADLTDMVRLFQNLIDNALKFRSAAAPRLEISARRIASVWVISVKDNGIGIEKIDSDRVFEMHQRLFKDMPGSGMGLAICKRIVEKFGGRIWLDSQVGVGSTFYLTLPPAVQKPERTVERA